MNSGIESSFYRWDTGNASGTRSEGRLLASIQAVNTLRSPCRRGLYLSESLWCLQCASRLPDEHGEVDSIVSTISMHPVRMTA
jgi:hypothetical protein